MVNNKNPRRLTAAEYKLRKSGERTRLIKGQGPIYDLQTAQELLNLHGLDVVNANAYLSMNSEFAPPLTKDDIKLAIAALKVDEHYVESEICKVANESIDADAYTIYWKRNGNKECKLTGTKLYIKFGFRNDDPKCLIVRVHRSKY